MKEDDDHHARRAVFVRELASQRVRRLTVAALAAAAGLTGVFAGLAAASSHAAGRTVTTAHDRSEPVTAPAPSLVPAEGDDSGGGRSDGQAQPPVAAPPVAPAPTTPPVAVSGGS